MRKLAPEESVEEPRRASGSTATEGMRPRGRSKTYKSNKRYRKLTRYNRYEASESYARRPTSRPGRKMDKHGEMGQQLNGGQPLVCPIVNIFP